ncbi:GL26414 [Drosophila persimilis]|uniref:Calmodulin-lysine N-methyltransferase n=1 Tax=Drosophila persimilis TaxID=7234 RepID=B4GSV0_DROPE|nr:GL26414 [Drosophila persimilis]
MSAILVQKLSAETQINSQTQQQPSRKTEQSPEVEVGHLATISLLLQYDIDNTLNAFKEHRRMTMDGRGMGMGTGGPGALAVNNNQDTDVNLNRTAAGAAVGPMAELELEGLAKGCPPAGAGQGFMPPTPPATPNLQNTAQKRWKILAKVLRKDSEETVSSSSDEFSEEQTASVRRFKSFDLLQQDSFEDHVSLKCLGKTENWYKYRMQLDNDVEYSVNIHHMERQLTASDLMGFNNTGNICVWPSEEALTALVLSEVSVDNVRKTACLNELSCYTKCSVLKWQERSARAQAEQEKFDFILCADCLFFDEARSALVDTIWYYLAPRGVALIMAPRRGRTLSMFQDECMARGFAVELATRYNETIWQRHLQLKADSALYDEDLHYPLLLRLCKTHS